MASWATRMSRSTSRISTIMLHSSLKVNKHLILKWNTFDSYDLGVYYGNVTENGTAGMMVMTMTATDYDDLEEGTNAKLKYSIEKNVIDENTGTPIFEIEEDTGVIKTAVCCLDRERTPDYSIQVVAMDGGGLKGKIEKSSRNQIVTKHTTLFSRIFFVCVRRSIYFDKL